MPSFHMVACEGALTFVVALNVELLSHRLLIRMIGTVYLEIFVVKIFSWLPKTTKLLYTKLFLHV